MQGKQARIDEPSRIGVFLAAALLTLCSCGGEETTPPSTPGDLTAVAVSPSSIRLAWSASTDESGIDGYRIYRGGERHRYTKELEFTDTGLSASTSYCYQVSAIDRLGNESPLAAERCATTWTAYSLTVIKSGTGTGTITGAGIDCGSDCTEAVAAGTVLTLTASPSSGSSFAGWSGCDSVAEMACTVTVDTSRTVVASFNATLCAAGQTRCVSGNIGVQETCNPSGTGWVRTSCTGFSLCSNNACRTVCDLTASPTYPTVCIVPNKDGKNDGEWLIWNASTMAVPTYTTGRSVTSTGGYAPIENSGLTWPYAWSISSQSLVRAQFKLSQFGGYRQPRLSFKAKRAGIVNDGINRFTLGVYNGTNLIGSCIGGPVLFSWQTEDCHVGAPYNQQLDYAGGWNAITLSITGDGYGSAIDLLQVNYVYLTIEP